MSFDRLKNDVRRGAGIFLIWAIALTLFLFPGCRKETVETGGVTDDTTEEMTAEPSSETFSGETSQESPEATDTQGGEVISEEIIYLKDVFFTAERESSRVMDIMYSDNGEKKPVLLLVHGGSYITGNKTDMVSYQRRFRRHFVTVSINYPLLPDGTMVQQYRCLKEALEFLAQNAELYGADMEHVVLLGYSAGAQLTVRAAEEIAQEESAGVSHPYHLDGVVDISGPTDFASMVAVTNERSMSLFEKNIALIDGVEDSDLETEFAKVDCRANISANMPPVLIIHGGTDQVVPTRISRSFFATLKDAGVDCELEIFPEEPHSVDLSLVFPRVMDFLKKIYQVE